MIVDKSHTHFLHGVVHAPAAQPPKAPPQSASSTATPSKPSQATSPSKPSQATSPSKPPSQATSPSKPPSQAPPSKTPTQPPSQVPPSKPPSQAPPSQPPAGAPFGEGEFEGRLRLPQKGEMFGIVTEMMGASHLKVRCQDGKVRMCRVVGRMKKQFWIQEGDIVIVAPWAFQTKDTKADVVWRYTKTQMFRLKRDGHLDWMAGEEGKELVF